MRIMPSIWEMTNNIFLRIFNGFVFSMDTFWWNLLSVVSKKLQTPKRIKIARDENILVQTLVKKWNKKLN